MEIEILITLFVVIALITLIGHGIWVLLAKIFRALAGGPESQSIPINAASTNDSGANRPRQDARCAECGTSLQIGDGFCPVCGLARSSVRPVEALEATARQLDRFLNQGRLDAATHKVVMELVAEERARLAPPVRRDAVTARREVEPQVPQRTPPVLAEPKVLTVERNVERPGPELVEPAASSAVPAVVAESPRQPRRSFPEMLETFMEESSIRWGELVGGLLIIGCSIALVVSLWSKIAAKPFLQFSVFIGVTTALFGLGFYSAHRWKLPTTSKGVLIISTLLAPLNFLAMAAFAGGSVQLSSPVVGAELFSLALFIFLVYQAARVFLPESPWMTALATMGPSFAMLLARHFSAAKGDSIIVALLGGAPLLCYCASCGVILRDRTGGPKQDEGDERRADQIFTHLGVASFAALLPLGLLFFKLGYISQTLRQFAPLVSVFGLPAIATGIALLQWPAENQSGKTETAATSAVLIGSLISLTALILAWPNSVAVVVTALINCAVALTIALASSWRSARYDLRLAHAGAIAPLSLAVLIVANPCGRNIFRWSEDCPRLITSLFSITSGHTLALLFALFAGASEWWLKKERKIEARIYGISAVLAAAFGLSLISAYGLGRDEDPHHAALVYAFYMLAAFVIAWRREKVAAAWIGSVLLLLAILQTLAFKFRHDLEGYHPFRLSLLVFANVAVIAAVGAAIRGGRARKLFAAPLASSALTASVVVAPLLIFEGWMTTAQISTRLLWLAAIWIVIAWLKRSSVLFAAFQLALASSAVFKIADLFEHRWPHSFIVDLRTIQAQAVALAILSLAWIATRLAFRRFVASAGDVESKEVDGEEPAPLFDRGVAAKLLYPGWLGVDRVITLLLLAFLVCLSMYGVCVRMVYALRPEWALSTESLNRAATALGAGSWALLAALSLVFIAGLWERFEKRAALAMLILLASACLLIAGRWGDAGLTPAVYRWSSAIAFAAVSSLIAARNRFTPWLNRSGWPQVEERSVGLATMLRRLSLALFVAPVLILSTLSLFYWISLSGGEDILSRRPGLVAGLIAPLLIVGLSFAVSSIRERSAAYACAAGLMVNLSVTYGCLLWVSARGQGIARADAYTVAQLNIIATSLCSIIWNEFHRRQTALDAGWPGSNTFLNSQIGLAVFFSLSALAVTDARIFIDPRISSALADSFGGLTGVLAVALPMLAYARFHDIKLHRLGAAHLGVGLIALGSVLSCLAGRLGTGDWSAFHTLAISLSAAAWLMLALRRPVRLLASIAQVADKRAVEYWISVLSLAVVAMILRGAYSTGQPWWTTGLSISTCLLFTGLSLASRSRGYIYIAAMVLNYAATRIYFWLDPNPIDLFNAYYKQAPRLVALNTIVLALPAIAWLAIDLRQLRQGASRRIAPFHRVAALLSLALLSLTLVFQWTCDVSGCSRSTGEAVLDWLSLVSVVALFAACLWDERDAYAVFGLHISGLIAAAMGLLAFNPGYEAMMVGAVVILSLYSLMTSALWRARNSLARLAARFRMPSGKDDLVLINLINVSLGVAAYAITFVIVLGFESLTKRMIAATSSFAIPISMALLANALRIHRPVAKSEDQMVGQASDNDSATGITPAGPKVPIGLDNLISLATWMSLLSGVLWGWAWLSPFRGLLDINRLAVVMVASGGILIAYRFTLRNLARENEWRRGAGGRLLIIGGVGLAALVAILTAEALNTSPSGVAGEPWWVVIAVFAVLVWLFCACITFALAPERDPFNFSERGRMNYVYGAEALTIVTAVHARMTMPWFFSGDFLIWWPLVVMLLAFTGVALGELFRRRGKLVLAEPLQRTGILLPILPVFGFWLEPSGVSYSNLLFLVGLFYGALSVMRRSFLFGILAVFAGNGGLWKLLSGAGGYSFYEHPQLWLIPVSVSILIAGQVNRERLTKDQITMIRYTTLMMIYVSSTSDIFINGVSDSLWLTVVLILLSLTGVFTGLLMRVRAFLYLGTAFLLLSLLTIIWTVSVSLNWGRSLWLVTGIAFGVMIIVAFALLEKKRREMLELVERLKQWQA
jgi:hypothetical protein